MKTLRLLVLAFPLCIALLAVAASPARADDDPATILRVEQARVTALEHDDYATLSRILADDLTYAHSNTQVDTKAGYLAALRSDALKYTSLQHEQQQVRLYGDTALLTGLTTVKSLTGGKPGEAKLRFLIVYLKRDQRWQMVAWQSTRLP